MQPTLAELLSVLQPEELVATQGNTSIAVTAPVVESTRDLEQGGVFVARTGLIVDGHDFIPQAIEKGAAAIVGEKVLSDLPVPYVQVRNPQQIMDRLAAAYFDFPSRKLHVIGVTGTNGKTTTTTLIYSILKQLYGRAGYISTIAADFGEGEVDTGLHVSTPEVPRVQQYLARMVENGLKHCVIEMTSHGLAQGRLNGVELNVGVLTNITHEHLNYHGSFENYLQAKHRLFEIMAASINKQGEGKRAIVNLDDPHYQAFVDIPGNEVTTFGIHAAADYQAINISYGADATHFELAGYDVRFSTALVGEFNVYNVLAALAAIDYVSHRNYEAVQNALNEVTVISGRMERIDEGQSFLAMVDFAHTPDALEKALSAARKMVAEGGRLITVFGSAGLRDVEKRRMMAEVAAQLADFTILTAEDPRTESLDQILQMMADGCISQGGVEGETFIRIPDRGQALYQACVAAKPGDVVIACGKGHEQSMCFGEIEYPWDDREALHAALRGEPLKTLPTAVG